MSATRKTGILLGLCCALAACEAAPTSEMTEPEAAPSEATAAAQASNTWVMRRTLSPWRRAMAAANISGVIYVVGGERRDFTPLARVDAYTVATNTWSSVASLPAARLEPSGATLINGKLYVSGGRNSSGNWTRTLFVYDPASNTWVRKADVPQTNCGGGVQGLIGGQLYVYTACVPASNRPVFFRYNPATNTWVTRPAPPTVHNGGAGAVVNGKLYLVAGFKPCTACGDPGIVETHRELDVYDPATNTWTTKQRLSSLRSSMMAAGLNGKLYLAGGSGEFETATLEVYDPSTNTWTMKAPMPDAVADGAAAVAGGKLFVISGVDSQHPLFPGGSKVFAYTP